MGAKIGILILVQLSRLPWSVLYRLSNALKFVIFDVVKYRREVIHNNLSKCFPDKSEEELKAITSTFQLHFTDVIVETLKCYRISKEELMERFVFENIEVLNEYYNEGISIVTILGHYGNWEMAGLAYSNAATHKPNLVYRPLSNKAFDAFILKIRKRFGADLIPEKRIFKKMFAEHKESVITNTALIGDQTPLKNRGVAIEFLGRSTPFFEGPELLASKFKTPVFFARVKKLRRGYYSCSFELLSAVPQTNDKLDITSMHVKALEESIREVPAYWLWSHRRWKYA